MSDHAARIAEALCRGIHPWRWEGAGDGPCSSCSTKAGHLADAGIGVLPEAEVTAEWGHRRQSGFVSTTEKWRDQVDWHTEASARREVERDGGAVVRRTREVRHSEHVTEWEAVDE